MYHRLWAMAGVALISTLISICVWPRATLAQRLVFPSSSSVDRAIPVVVHGLQPRAVVVLRSSVRDADGRLWLARATFRADSAGTVDTSRNPSLSGDYQGIETAGLFIHMHAVGDSVGRARFNGSQLSSLSTTIALEDTATRTRDSVVVERFVVGPDVRAAAVSHERLKARLFRPPLASAPGIVVLGGSEGGYPDDAAALLATNGFVALSLAYFNADGLPAELAEIPLDYVEQAVAWLRAQPGVQSDRVALFGTSKGAEAALLVASHVNGIRAVVAYAPSSVAWSCICSEPAKSSWTLRGQPVPSAPPGSDPAYRPASGEPIRPTVHYLYRLQRAPSAAAIPVERIAGPVLLVAGGDDQLWPSLNMARAVMRRRATAPAHNEDQLLEYPRAGHLIGKAYLPAGSTRVGGGRLEAGGSPAENARAQADAWPKVLALLAKSLAP